MRGNAVVCSGKGLRVAGRLLFVALVGLALVLNPGKEARADWTQRDLSEGRRGIPAPKIRAEQLPRLIRDSSAGVRLAPASRDQVADRIFSQLEAQGAVEGIGPGEGNLQERLRSALRAPAAGAGAAEGDGGAWADPLAGLPQDIAEGIAANAEERAKRGGFGITPWLLKFKRAGFSLRRVAHRGAGYADPAEFSYTRNLQTDEDAFQVEAGLTWKARTYIQLARGASGPSVLWRPTAWGAGNVTTARPDDSNWYGAGAGAEFKVATCGSACRTCCGSVMLVVNVGGEWTQSQTETIEKVSAFAHVKPIVADWALGFRKPLGGTYGTHATSFIWSATGRLDYGHTERRGTSLETAETFVRGRVAVSGTLYFDALGRSIRGVCADGSSDICNPDGDKAHDPALKFEYNGYWLSEEDEYLDWVRLGLVIPIVGEEGFSLNLAYERGAQAPVSFRHAELFSVTLGVRF